MKYNDGLGRVMITLMEKVIPRGGFGLEEPEKWPLLGADLGSIR
jgi:hypothetical protein